MTSVVVVDASVAIKWVIREQYADEADALLNQWTATGTRMIAPALFAFEIANVLYHKVARTSLSLSDMVQSFQHLTRVGVELDSASWLGLGPRAMELAHRHGLPAAYDAHYLALAEREGCEYWTADERLWNTVKAQLPWVRWLGSFGAGASAQKTP